MGLFSFIKRQLLEVIEWEDNTKDTIVYRFPVQKREEIMNSSTLIVHPGQCAIFVHKGQVADVFAPGTYKLATENIPFLTKMLSLPTGFNSPIKADVYFVNTKQFTGQKWGTQNPIMMRDSDFGNIRLRGFGVFAFKVDDPKRFMQEVFSTNAIYTTRDIIEHCKPILIQGISDAIAESQINALDLAANYREFSQNIVSVTTDEFKNLGLKLTSFVIENLSLPTEVENALDERTKMGVLEDKMGTYTQYQAANAMRDAANNPSDGNMAGIGVGLGAGATLGQVFANSINTQTPPKDLAHNTQTCPKCNTTIPHNKKFCPECGEKLGNTCPKCGASVKKNNKFCPECGEKLTKNCTKCGAELKSSHKFCPECGENTKKDN